MTGGESVDAVVIGGGIVGASVAFHLGERGRQVVLVDRADEGRATEAGAGIIAPEMDSTESEGWYALASQAKRYYPRLVDALNLAGDDAYAERGILLVDPRDGDSEGYDAAVRRLRERVPAGELTPLAELAQFDDVGLSNVERGIYYPHAARVDGAAMRDALVEAAEDAGADLHRENATDLLVAGDSVVGVETDAARYDADTVVLAGGAWSSEFADRLGIALPVTPVRGQILHLDVPDRALDEWPIVNTVSGTYFVPWSADRLVVGATHESDVGHDPQLTASGVHSLLDAALDRFEGLEVAELADARVGLRPATPDGKPVVGAVPGVDGAYLATGHGSTGLLLGPYTGKLVADLVLGDEPAVDPAPFCPTRFDRR